ncbi:30S ribosomal protein S8e, partial [Candidatus Woesearchaeota archaeon]|nr:30S ribosomal protein S8e [Candidatus Woesearchaeota archaeon]
VKVKAGGNKQRLLQADVANVLDPKTQKCQKSKIKTIMESPANRHFVRRNIMTKGTIIETEAGKARITSRPGQDGTVNAVLV